MENCTAYPISSNYSSHEEIMMKDLESILTKINGPQTPQIHSQHQRQSPFRMATSDPIFLHHVVRENFFISEINRFQMTIIQCSYQKFCSFQFKKMKIFFLTKIHKFSYHFNKNYEII